MIHHASFPTPQHGFIAGVWHGMHFIPASAIGAEDTGYASIDKAHPQTTHDSHTIHGCFIQNCTGHDTSTSTSQQATKATNKKDTNRGLLFNKDATHKQAEIPTSLFFGPPCFLMASPFIWNVCFEAAGNDKPTAESTCWGLCMHVES